MTANLHVNLGERSYDIHFSTGDKSGVGAFARERSQGSLAFIVTDEHVQAHAYAISHTMTQHQFLSTVVVRPAGEGQKSLVVASTLYDKLAEIPADRRTLIIAVGGGVIGDLAGFVAATYNRGLDLLMVPTTMLAMVDSSVGGKVGINHPKAKNLIGAFHQPRGVWIDTAYLDTLPEREFRSGLAEVVKYGVIQDAQFFGYLEQHADDIIHRKPEVLEHIIHRCCQLKAEVVEKDERELTGLRAILNYGHTFAHAFESAAGYGRWLHGEAVAAGMICASMLANQRGLIPDHITRRQCELLQKFSLPTAPEDWDPTELIATMRADKKSLAGKLRFILPTRLGEVKLFDNIPDEDVLAVLKEVAA